MKRIFWWLCAIAAVVSFMLLWIGVFKMVYKPDARPTFDFGFFKIIFDLFHQLRDVIPDFLWNFAPSLDQDSEREWLILGSLGLICPPLQSWLGAASVPHPGPGPSRSYGIDILIGTIGSLIAALIISLMRGCAST